MKGKDEGGRMNGKYEGGRTKAEGSEKGAKYGTSSLILHPCLYMFG
jgi:hypothetical protein